MSEKYEGVDWKVRHEVPGKRAINSPVGEIELDMDGVVVRVRGISTPSERDEEGRVRALSYGDAPTRDEVLELPGFLDMGEWDPDEDEPDKEGGSDLDIEDVSLGGGDPEPTPEADEGKTVADCAPKFPPENGLQPAPDGVNLVAEETMVPGGTVAPETVVPGDASDS